MVAEGAGGDAEAEDGVVEEAGERDGVLGLGDLALALGGAEAGGEETLDLAGVGWGEGAGVGVVRR